MTQYEVVGKHVTISSSNLDEDTYHPSNDKVELEPGEVYDELEIPESALEAFPDRFREVTVADSGDEGDEVPDPGEYTIDEFEELLEGGEYDDVLGELEEREAEGRDRSGIQSAIDERRE